jgi:RNA-directed DNA polymerase
VHTRKGKAKQHLKRSNPGSLQTKLTGLRAIIIGWLNYFMIAESKKILQKTDEQIRTRARICQWHQWKRVRTQIRHLKGLVLTARKPKNGAIQAGESVEWHITQILTRTLTNQYLTKLGLMSFYNYYFINGNYN